MAIMFAATLPSRLTRYNSIILAVDSQQQWELHPISTAIVFELTRFGGRVFNNSNRKPGDPTASSYLDIAFPKTEEGKDNIPVPRIVMDAKPRQAVMEAKDLRSLRGLHPEGLRKVGAGKPNRDARALAISHAGRMARSADRDEREVEAYLANLQALFVIHDKTLGITVD